MQPLHEKLSRRRMSLILGSLTAVPAHAQTKKGGTTIHQEIDSETTPARIYETLLDAKQFSAFTKDPAEIEPQPGAAFKLFGGRGSRFTSDRIAPAGPPAAQGRAGRSIGIRGAMLWLSGNAA